MFFQRFFGVQSFAQHDRFCIAMACLFLASKVMHAELMLA